MSDYMSVFRSADGQEQVFKAYDEIMAKWPVPYEELFIPTRLGSTHVIASGQIEAPPLILVHAFCASAASWYMNVEGLSKAYRVYCVDIIGDANKSKPYRYIRQLEDFVGWFNDLLDGLLIKHASLAGNSIGGFLASNYALQQPERVKSLILIGPAATFRQIMPFYLNTFPAGMTGWEFLIRHAVKWCENRVPFDPAWKELFHKTLKYGKGVSQVFPSVYTDEQLKKLEVPTLLLLGDRERIYDLNLAMDRAKALMPDIEIEIIKDANHITALSQPEKTNAAMLRFLNKITATE